MLSRPKYLVSLVLILCIAVVPLELSAQCAMCKAAAETSMKNDPNSMARSLNSGILYLMAVPYVMILFIFRKPIIRFLKSRFGKDKALNAQS